MNTQIFTICSFLFFSSTVIAVPEKPAEKPESSTHKTKKLAKKPKSSTHKTKKPAEKPESSTHKTKKLAKKPKSSTHKTKKPTEKTKSSTHKTKKPAEKPESSTHKTKKLVEKPESSTHKTKKLVEKPIKAKKKSANNRKKQKKPSADSLDSSVIKSMTSELDFLNKTLAPQTKKKSAVDHIKENKHRKTIDLQESLEDSSPRSLLILAQAYENTGDYENQIRVLRKLVKKDKKNGTYLLELAKGLRKLYFKTGLFAHRNEVIDIIQKTLTLNKKYHERAQMEMLELLKFKADSEENNYAILKLLQTLIREYGIKRKYIKDICKYFYINKFYNQSLSGCKKAIRYDPKEPSNYIYYALSMEKQEDKEKQLKFAGKKFPNSSFVQVIVGQFFIEQQEYTSAFPYFQTASKIDSNSAEARLGLAQSLFNTGKEKKSYKHFMKACMLNKHKMLWAFKQAKSILNQKSKFKLANSFENGITKCFLQGKHIADKHTQSPATRKK